NRAAAAGGSIDRARAVFARGWLSVMALRSIRWGTTERCRDTGLCGGLERPCRSALCVPVVAASRVLFGADRMRTIAVTFTLLLFAVAQAHAHGEATHEHAEWTFDAWILAPLLVSASLYAAGLFVLWRRAGW